MNVTNLSKSLTAKLLTSTSTYEMMLLSKSIQELKLGNVSVVNSFTNIVTNLPPPPGNLVYVEDERTIYYQNTINGTTNWESLFVPEREIYGWGNNSGGALGDGSALNRSSPTLLLVAQNNWTYIGTNDFSCFATDIHGYAYAWGANAQGQLGNNSTVATTSPVSIVGLLNNWTKIVGGDARTFGLRSNGEVFGWGQNLGFRLGDATSINKSSPSKIFSDKSWTDIAAGHYHCLGIASTGELWGWGEGGLGQLGDGFGIDRSVPVRVQGNISDWSKIAGTENSSAAIRSNGQMYTWGENSSGVLGNNTTINRSSPHSVPYFADWKLVAGGLGHILALRNEGTLWAWGRNIEGCLADGTTINRSSPVLVIGGKTNWVNIAGFNASASSIAIDTTGDVWVWGAGLAGIGDGFAVRRSSPVSIKPPIVDHLYQNWIQIAISENRWFALKG